MGYQDFLNGLKELGFDVQEHGGNRVTFRYAVEVGKFAGKEITVGYDVPGDFPANPPEANHAVLHPEAHFQSGPRPDFDPLRRPW